MSDFREEEALGKVYDSHLTAATDGILAAVQGWVVFALVADTCRGAAGARRARVI